MRSLVLYCFVLASNLAVPIPGWSENMGLRTNTAPPQIGATPPQAAARQKTCGELYRDAPTAELNRHCVAMAGPLAAYRDGTLTLRMEDGKRKVFKNDGSEAQVDAFGYALLDFYPTLRLFVVTYSRVDDGVTTVVDARTGRTIDYGSGFPIYSPSGRWILVDDSNASGGDPSAFRVLDATATKPTLLWSSKTDPTTLSSRRFQFVRWEDDTRVRFELGRGKSPVLLVRAEENGRWHYDLADDADEAESSATEKTATPDRQSKR